MKKVPVILLAGMLCASLFAGCGSTQENENSEISSTETASWSAGSSESAEISDYSAYYSDYYVEITDDLGRTVELHRPPQRVAVLNGSYAETWLLAGGEISAVVKDASVRTRTLLLPARAAPAIRLRWKPLKTRSLTYCTSRSTISTITCGCFLPAHR